MPRTRRTTTALAALAVAAVLGGAATLVVGPRPPSLDGAPVTGDAALADDLLAALGPDGVRAASVAVVDLAAPADERVRTAAVGVLDDDGAPVRPGTPFETGSVAKALDGLLLAEMLAAGEVRLDEPVADLVPGTALADDGDATLRDLATHRSGLPRLPASMLLTGPVLRVTGGDPYTGGPADVLDAAGRAGAPGGAGPRYSNLGAAALGQALATRAGVPWDELLTARVLAPAGLTATTVATSPDEVPADGARPVTAAGRDVAPWVAEGWAPAGVGTWSTAEDLGLLALGLIEGTAPGVAALDPVDDDPARADEGLLWVVGAGEEHPGVVWHNGGTAGSSTFVGLDRGAGRAVVVLATTDRSVDDAALAVLAGAGDEVTR